MQKNKATTYLLYALGEIVLVVFGILIALAINNMNEERKERQFEGKILVEIYNGLRADSTRLADWIIPRIESKKTGVQEMAALLDRGHYPGDSTFMSTFRKMSGRMQVSINFGAFETLKSSGMNKVNSAEVRFWLIDLYESLLPRQLDFIGSATISNRDYLIETRRALFISKPVQSKQGAYYYSVRSPKFQNILKDERLFEVYQTEEYISDELDHRISIMTDAIERTLDNLRTYFIDKEISYPDSFETGLKGIRGLID